MLRAHPALWHLPALTRVFEEDEDAAVRVLAGTVIRDSLGDKSKTDWWVRLETRDAALGVARRSLRDKQAPPEVRRTAFEILRAWDCYLDRPLLKNSPDGAG